MNKRVALNFKIILFFIIFLVVILNIVGIFSKHDMNHLPNGNKIDSIVSPNKKYTMNIYLIDGGPISADSIRVEIKDGSIKTKNIYYFYNKNSVNAIWIDDENVKIDNIKLNIYKDSYSKN